MARMFGTTAGSRAYWRRWRADQATRRLVHYCHAMAARTL
jgi:hypothetical protein